MRDGTKLDTLIISPKVATKQPLPFLINRSPYGLMTTPIGDIPKDLLAEGFTFVFQDIRGRFKSEGQFVMMRPHRDQHNPSAVDEASDTYDTISYLLNHVPNNGKAAIYGGSYDGWLSLCAAADPHPALKVAFPAASPLDMWMNDDFHRNGALRLSYGFEYSYMMETSKENEQYKFELPDTYDWYLKLGALSHVNEKYFKGQVPTWNGFVQHPNHDSYWTDQSLAGLLAQGPKIPTISIAGEWDQEDPWGPQDTFRLFSKHDPNHFNHLLLGPWNHGQWEGVGAHLGPVQFGTSTSAHYKNDVLIKGLLYYLKGQGDFSEPTADVFVTGTNRWQGYSKWPPKTSSPEKLYLQAGNALSFSKPGGGNDSYVSDPANPVPYRHRPVEATYGPGSHWYNWQIEDQRFVEDRPDVLTYRTDNLAHDLTIVGTAKAHLVAATSGTDCDWVVKVIDEYPEDGDGDSKMSKYELPIAMEVVRARFRESGTNPKPVPSGKPLGYTIDLHGVAHTFKKGHRLMVQVQSTWFPVIDRNPQKFVPNILLANDSDFQKATQTIYHQPGLESYLELPVEKM